MSPKVTAVLLVIFVGLCGAYWWALSQQQQSRIREYEAKKVFSVKAADLRQITVQRVDEAATVGSRSGADAPWKITHPYPIKAYQHAWERLTATFANLSDQRPIASAPKDLAQYGLGKPRVTVDAVAANGHKYHIALGASDPTQTCVYAKTKDRGVFLVPKEAVTDLDRPLQDLRDRRMVSGGKNDKEGITYLEYARIAGKKNLPKGYAPGDESVAVVLDRQSDGAWKLVKPVAGFANSKLVNKLISGMEYLVGRKYVDAPESLDDYGLDPPAARVTVRFGAHGKPQTVFFGALYKGDAQGGVWVKNAAAPAVFVVDSNIIEQFPKTPDAFRDKRMFTRFDKEIQALHYVAGTTDFTLELDPTKGWRIAQPPVPDSDQAVISNFIALLKVMTCSGFVNNAKLHTALDHPAIQVTITMKDQPKPATISVGAPVPPNGDVYYAMQDNGTVVTLNQADVNALTRTLTDFRSKKFLRFNKALATAIDMRFEGVNYKFVKTPGTGAWAIQTPPGKVWESQTDMTALLGAVQGAHMATVESQTAPADLSVYGLDKPLVVITVTTQSGPNGAAGATLGPLNIGGTTKNDTQQRYATVQGRSEVFRVDQALVDTIRDALRGIRDQK